MRGRPGPVRHGHRLPKVTSLARRPSVCRFGRTADARQLTTVGAEHYFSAEPNTPVRPTTVEFTAAGRSFRLAAGAGVFSAGTTRSRHRRPACGRRRYRPPRPRVRCSTSGCGYGPIACVLATVAPRTTVYAVDINARARELARTNARDAGIADRMIVCAPDEVSEEVRFAEIWSNPPIRVGKSELHGLMRRWLPRLDTGGTAWLVVAKHLGGDSLADWLAGPQWHGRSDGRPPRQPEGLSRPPGHLVVRCLIVGSEASLKTRSARRQGVVENA